MLVKQKNTIFDFNGPNHNYPESILSLDGERIDNVKTFKYLGSQVQYDQPSTGDTEITCRIDMAESKFYEHGKKLMNFRIHLSTRVSILNSLVRSTKGVSGCSILVHVTKDDSRRIRKERRSLGIQDDERRDT